MRVDLTEFGGIAKQGEVNRQHQLYAYAYSEYVDMPVVVELEGFRLKRDQQQACQQH